MSSWTRSDRPFRRSLWKLGCRLLGSRRAHYHSWLPSLRIAGRTVSTPGAVEFHHRKVADLHHIDALKARSGERIVIVGSGPSVRGQDLSCLPPRSAVLLNGAISLVGGAIAEPLAVAIEDERFVWRHFDMIEAKVGKSVLCLLGPGVIRALLEIDRHWLDRRTVILIDDIRKPYGGPRRSPEELQRLAFVRLDPNGRAGFSTEPDRGVFQGGSVAISALQFALAADAGEIGFLGVDISNAGGPRFYEAAGDVAFSGIAGAEGRILAHIALARHEADARGIRLVNHSPVSALKTIGLAYEPLEPSRS